MKLALVVAILFIGYSIQQNSIDFDYYHSTQDLEQQASQLINNCNNLLKIDKLPEAEHILMYSFNANGQQQQDKTKAFYLFGEHAREMISPETGLKLLQTLCGQRGSKKQQQKVENGDYCLRTNENGVDINRNWDAHWEEGSSLLETNPGEHPFSEVETLALKNVVTQFQPDIFLSVHSGTTGMYTPYAFSEDEGSFNENNMLSILSQLNNKYCNCDAGAAGKEVGYLCPGTCLDYVYDKLKTPYSYAFEIYSQGDEDYIKLDNDDNYESFLEVNQNSKSKKHIHHGEYQNIDDEGFIIEKQQKLRNPNPGETKTKMSENQCFSFFNPSTKDAYNKVTENWTDAMLDLMIMAHDKQKTI